MSRLSIGFRRYSPHLPRRWSLRSGAHTGRPFPRLIALASCLGLACLGSWGCLVDGQCLGDADCPGGRICVKGDCRWECSEDTDCSGCRRCVGRRCTECCRDSDCPAEERCEAEVCVPAAGCLTCGSLPNGTGACLHGICIVAACDEGWHDANSDPTDGCEYGCTPTTDGSELCNGLDDDCDGRVDEDFNFDLDPEHCGDCNRPCPTPPKSTPVCAGGLCYFLCEPGVFDNDGEAPNGCEADVCEVTAGGVE
ncbi:MAG: hypothetical protein RBU30_13305, partial [Polyangia bacterium]|nr:hypothetical protein [Polyangia bacterium]